PRWVLHSIRADFPQYKIGVLGTGNTHQLEVPPHGALGHLIHLLAVDEAVKVKFPQINPGDIVFAYQKLDYIGGPIVPTVLKGGAPYPKLRDGADGAHVNCHVVRIGGSATGQAVPTRSVGSVDHVPDRIGSSSVVGGEVHDIPVLLVKCKTAALFKFRIEGIDA